MTNPIFSDSPEAATPVQVTAWRTPNGQLFIDESTARSIAATHRRCGTCATPIPSRSWSKCDPCREIEEAQRYAAKRRKPWDGVAMVYSEVLDDFFSSPEYAREAAVDRNEDRDTEEEPAIDPDNLRLVICEPCYAPTINSDYFADLMEDPEIPDAFLDVVRAFNSVARKTVVSWGPGKFALTEIEKIAGGRSMSTQDKPPGMPEEKPVDRAADKMLRKIQEATDELRALAAKDAEIANLRRCIAATEGQRDEAIEAHASACARANDMQVENVKQRDEIARLKATAREYFEAHEGYTLAILSNALPGYTGPSKDEATKRYGEAIKAMRRVAGYEVVNDRWEREQ